MSDIIGHNEPLVKIACNTCKHLHGDNMEAFSCDAFDNIPKEILSGKNMHTKPLPGQKNKIVFEPIKK
jgi:hypothetical protein